MNYLVEIQNYFEVHKDEQQAASMSAYMKGQFEYLGIKAPLRKKLLASFLKEHGKPNRWEIEDILIGLWSLPQREYQYCGIEIAEKVLRPANKEDILIIEYLLEYKQWWDTVDMIASHLVGRVFKAHEDVKKHYFDKWSNCSDMWLNRTAMLFQLKYKDETDTDLLKKAILQHKNSNEFFHQKAIGWALRQYSKVNKGWVSDFLSKQELAPLSIREASKYL